MSRIERARILNASTISSTQLNASFDDFVQPNEVDETNHRDSSVDLAQLKEGLIIIHAKQGVLGTGDISHSTHNNILAATSGPATKVPLVDALSTGTPLVLTGGWALEEGQILRVYWDLSVQSYWEIEEGDYPWDAPGCLGIFEAYDYDTLSLQPWNAGLHFWLCSLQWNLASGTPVWEDVPNQSAMNGLLGGRSFGELTEMQACVPINAWQLMNRAADVGDLGKAGDQFLVDGWHGINGTYYYVPTSPVTVYGLRIVLHGIYHPYNNAGTNLAILDTDVATFAFRPSLRYTTGNILAIHQFIG